MFLHHRDTLWFILSQSHLGPKSLHLENVHIFLYGLLLELYLLESYSAQMFLVIY